jgi:hypothetical protein
MEVVDVCIPSTPLPCCFAKQDICSSIYNTWLSEALLYFLPNYTLDKKGMDDLYAGLRRAALVGGDCITLWGRGAGNLSDVYLMPAFHHIPGQ